MKRFRWFLAFIIIVFVMSGCKKKEKLITKEDSIIETNTPSPTVTPTEEPSPSPTTDPHRDEVESKLTGLYVSKSVASKRPYAIMFNNIKVASPQSGTSEADILYEAIVEGGITRLMGIFEQAKSDRIGSTRSARHYFVSIADEYDAIYVHFGQTKYATAKMKKLGINDLSGLSGIGTTVFYRDPSIKAPHNAFTSLKGLLKGTRILGYRTKYNSSYEGHFKFYDADTDLTSDKVVNKLILNFSNYTSPYFTYDKQNKCYLRYQFGVPHIDANTKKQLKFKNIIIQLVREWNIDRKGYQTMDIENASGEGYYITNGKAMKITWKKNEATRKMRYYSEDGSELKINAGKTYIAIFPNNRTSGVVFK
ncbi:DUF3048 domain-containing protein [Anaeromicropila herbilytica]|uniref:DUF3048 domain-containing protein n=1 Tax=Anaeromicropila herbilytica TaxID=2785025 RepID=A0A7R7EKS6_9FIRM|nr:DUF3048 domain-containing protein [Anaeromicropila herbilytica]BCN30583.1 hypothetical protein bsdtb5_18780 [Anaeromicropila herbilytica]